MAVSSLSLRLNWFTLNVLTAFVAVVHASHFRGGLVHWKTVGPINRTAGVTVDITQRYGWRRSYSSGTYCDASIIASGRIIANHGVLSCRTGCFGSLGNVGIYCTDYSFTDDWSVGEKTHRQHLSFSPVIEASFSSVAWISLVRGGGSWEVRTKINLNATLARRGENAAPETKMSPILNLLHGCNHTITIPVEDDDGDDIRCRWAESRLGECGGVCQAFPGAILNERECTMFYSATGTVGLYAVAIQIEDFHSSVDTTPFSSVPLQFIVNVYVSPFENASCYGKPTFSWPTRRDGACVGIPLNTTFHEAIIAESGGPDVTIRDVTTQSPAGVRKSVLAGGPAPNNWYVNITWTPALSQLGNNIFCFTAIDSSGANSDQNCITFAVGTHPPAVRTESLFPTGELLPTHSNWGFEFDRKFVRPRRAAYIRFYEDTGREVFTVDTASNINVKFPALPTELNLTFVTTYRFKEKAGYYITLDHGIVYGIDACGPESVGEFSEYFWRFTIRDVTPPVLTFSPYNMYSAGSMEIAWTFDEPATCICLVQSPSKIFTVTCNDSMSLSNLTEGDFTLFVQASDINGNAKQYQTSWYVDLTPPIVTITSRPPLIVNKRSSSFTLSCTDRSSCQLWCADHALNQTELMFVNCSSKFTSSYTSDGVRVLTAYGEDDVGNVGERVTYTWTVDTIPPTFGPLSDVTVACGSPYDPSRTGIPTYSDNTDHSPSASYNDTQGTGCRTIRTWTVRDHAGNTATVAQTISFTNVIGPTVKGAEEIFVPCGETDRLESPDYVIKALSVTSPCGRKVTVDYTNSRPITDCGITVTRQWRIMDDCNSVTLFRQTIHVLFQTFPDFPANGQMHVRLSPVLGWPTYPQSQGYSVYVWQYGTSEPSTPISFVPIWSRRFTFVEKLPPNTRFLWRIGYIVPFGNGTREIPSPTWGFHTESYADLSVISVQVPPSAFSGSSFSVTWMVENVGNVSTSQSSSIYYDAIYLSRSSDFRDAYLATGVWQQRYVDPQDGYTSTDEVRLQPSDIGTFYVFVVVDVYRRIADFSVANNRLVATQPVQIKLTPPPNLQVKSANVVGFVLSGQQKTVRITIENSGLGITQATRWYDQLLLSVDDERSRDDRVLTTVVRTGALASGQRYVNSVSVTIPNAIYGDYYIIVSTDIYKQVFEHTDANDNDFALKISIVLSPYPDLIVSNITVSNVATTGDTLWISAVVKNSGTGEPFEYSWKDGLKITSTTNGVHIFSYEKQYVPGRTPFVPSSTYLSVFEYTIPPSALTGDYNVTVSADALNQVFEFQSDNNNAETVRMRINQELPDLTVGQSSAVVVENGTGNYLSVSISIVNSGPGEPQIPSWENAIVLSSTRSTVQLMSFLTASAFSQRRIVSNLTAYISASLVGTFDVRVSIDSRSQVIEVDDSNNNMNIGRVVFQERVPDLTVTSINATSSAESGSVIIISWTVENVGNLASRHELSWFDEISLTAESGLKISLSRVLISFADNLAPRQSYEHHLNVTIPSNLAGMYRLGVTTALYTSRSAGAELNQGNNYRGTRIAISTPPSPDFKPSSCSFELDFRFAARILTVVCTVTNVGNSMDRPMTWTDRISLVNADGSVVLSTFVTGLRKLLFGDTYSTFGTLVISPTTQGYFQISVVVDSSHNVTEIGGENNNALRESSVVFIPPGPSPQLSVSIEPLQQSTFLSGTTLSVNCSVTNAGDADLQSSSWTDSLFLFSTPAATKQQVILSGFLISSIINSHQLKTGASYSEIFSGVLPYSTRGPMYVYVVSDVNNRLPTRGGSGDRAAHLNTTIDVVPGPLPDLKISVTGNSSVISLQSGQVYVLEFTVSNIGNASASGIWYDSVYLSQDKIIDPFDIALKTTARPRRLDTGESYVQHLSFVVPFDLPAFTYYFTAVTNVRQEVFETTFDNNDEFQLVEIAVLPAVDLVVANVTSSSLNATYLQAVDFQWSVANNGSIATIGYKCDSVYLSSDAIWQITDVTVVPPRCGSFSLARKGDSGDRSIYRSIGHIPPVAKGSYKSIVRTRSNVKDHNLQNNIGVSAQNMSVNPPTIRLGENKSFTLKTNADMTFELTNISLGIAFIVRLNTLYNFAYHGLFIKRNSPPATNDYDVAYKDTGTTQQTVYVQYTKSGDYYLLVESSSAVFQESYQISISVKEAKFEVTSIYPNIMSKSAAVTIRISGTLFGSKLQALLTNDSATQTAVTATEIYRYTSELAYATFSSQELSPGRYSLLFQDIGRKRSFELKDAVLVSGLAIAGKLQVDIVIPTALRPGRTGVVDVKVNNIGYSDVPMPLLLLSAGDNTKVLSAQSDLGVLPTTNVAFFPLTKNYPPSTILPKSAAAYSFRVLPDDEDFVGSVPISLYTATHELVLEILRELKADMKHPKLAGDVWEIVWRNVENCFASNPTRLLQTINGRFTQHYAAMSPIASLIRHVVKVADGAVPPLSLSQSVDVQDNTYSSPLVLGISRVYSHQLSVRRTSGLFGIGWSSPLLEMTVSMSMSDNTVRLTKQRQEFIFTAMDDTRSFYNRRLPADQITVNSTSIVYTSQSVAYIFDVNSGFLKHIEAEREAINIMYNVNNRPVMLTHQSSGSTINIAYTGSGLISRADLSQSGNVLSEVYYTYTDSGYLTRVATGGNVIEYQYTENGDLSWIVEGNRRTAIIYDRMHLMSRIVEYFGDIRSQEIHFRRFCDGHIEITILPQNLSSLFAFGLDEELIETIADGLPVSIQRDNVRDTVDVTVGDELKQTLSFDRSSQTYFITNANDDKLAVKLGPDGRVNSIGDEQLPYYNATYVGDKLSAVMFRDGTRQSFAYNGQGQRSSLTLRDGSQMTYTYDSTNQFLSTIGTSSGRYVYNYNSVGLLTSVTSPDGGTTTLTYNSQRFPMSVTNPDGTTLTYTYNHCDQRSSVISNTGYNCSYVYDSYCRLTAVLDDSGNVVAAYEYGQHSQVIKKRVGNGMYTEYAYETGSMRLQSVRNFFPNNTLLSYYSYVYDELGYRVQTETREGIWKYRYDASGQLIEWRSPFSQVYENIEYGSNLNRKSKQTATDKFYYSTNSLYQYTMYGNSENFTYDLNGNLLSKSKRVGTRTSVEQYTYDQQGRCTSVTTEQMTCGYQYDVFGALSSKNCSNGQYTKYLVDPFGTYGTNVLAEDSGSGQKALFYGQEYGLLAALMSDDAAMFYMFDGDGSTVQTASHTGEILKVYVYDPFGRLLMNSMNDVNVFRFLGQYGIQVLSETSSTVLIRNRLYDSEHGRFISPDPTGVFGSPTNPYTYGNNNPLVFKDTNGLLVQVILWQVGKGALLGAAGGSLDYFTKLALSGDEFSWKKFGKAVGTSALNGAISSANPFDSLISKFAFNFGGTLLTGGNLLDSVESGLLGLLPDGLEYFILKRRYAFDRLILDHYLKELHGGSATELLQRKFMEWVRSIDPNEITGPVGYGDANYISADQSLLYKIEFENNPNATAPAQKVIIRCPIDYSLELGSFKVGLVRFDIYEKDFGFRSPRVPHSRVDATEKTGTYVEMQVFIDVRTREAVWLLQSVDPGTGLPPSNPLIGFLPPNNGTNGQGYVTFSIDLKTNAQTLTKITENASIVFDENPHIDTSTVVHTIDKTAATVYINASTVFGSALFNLVTADVGSGVRSVDLYIVVDGSAELIKSGINQSVAIISLTGNVLHTVVGVATDNVGNSGTVDASGSVGIYVPAECPGNCSGRGECASGGVCICDSGYGGYNCSANVTVSCEPPILEVSHSDSVLNDSLIVFISARSSQPGSAASLSVKINCVPNDTVVSKGRVEVDGIYLDKDDFGNVELSTPTWFHGLLVCTIQATVVDVCGTNVRAVLLAANVVVPTEQSTVKTYAVTAATISVDATAARPATTSSVPHSLKVNPRTAATVRTDQATGTYASQPTGLMSSTPVIPVTDIGVTQPSAGPRQETTGSSAWGAWSNWTTCSRSCDTGVQQRTRQCLLSPSEVCGPYNTDRRFCQLSSCPVSDEEASEGSVFTMSRSDTAKVMERLVVFLRWVANAVNSYCFDNSLTCCLSVFNQQSNGVLEVVNFTSVDLVRLAAGYPMLPQGNADAVTKVIVMVDRSLLRSPCMVDSSRRKRQTRDLVPLNKTLLTIALLDGQSAIQSELNIMILDLREATDDITTTTIMSTSTSPGGPVSVTVWIVVVVAILVVLVISCCLVAWRRRRPPSHSNITSHSSSSARLPMRVINNRPARRPDTYRPPMRASSAGVYLSAAPERGIRNSRRESSNGQYRYYHGYQDVSSRMPIYGCSRSGCQATTGAPQVTKYNNSAFSPCHTPAPAAAAATTTCWARFVY